MIKLLILMTISATATFGIVYALESHSKRIDANARSAYVCPRTMTDPITVKTSEGWLIVCVTAPEIKR
jgi:hypothetical protein